MSKARPLVRAAASGDVAGQRLAIGDERRPDPLGEQPFPPRHPVSGQWRDQQRVRLRGQEPVDVGDGVAHRAFHRSSASSAAVGCVPPTSGWSDVPL